MICDCYRCTMESVENDRRYNAAHAGSIAAFDPRFYRMFLCPICGNKRCPKATDHRLICTMSDKPGQEGSRYE